MRATTRTIVVSSVLALSSVSAQLASICPKTGVCFKLNIPESTASSGNGDIFFQISAPSTYEYVALGQGGSMGSSNMFLVYTNSDNTNVTLSPRTASGHTTPSFNSAAQVTLLEGSGVKDGVMTANVRCSNCNSWSSGAMDFKTSSGTWVYAYQSSNGPKRSNDQSASIRQHNEEAVITWEWASAKGGSSINPLVAAVAPGTGNGGAAATSCRQRVAASATGAGSATQAGASPTQSSNSDDNNDDDDDRRSAFSRGPYPTARPTHFPPSKRQELPYCDEISNSDGLNGNSNAGFRPIGGGTSATNTRTMLIAHGVLASLAFVILFPMGSIAIRLASFPGIIWIHAAFQIFAYIVYIAGFGLGVYLAKDLKLMSQSHPIIGIVVLLVLFVQPILGWMHHAMFKKYAHRTLWSHAHIWVGRIAITVGILNGGLGLKLADDMRMSSRGGMIAYGVVALVMWLAWVAASFVGERRRAEAAKNGPPKYSVSQRHGSNGSEVVQIAPEVQGHYAPPKKR